VKNHLIYIICLFAGCVVYYLPLSALAALSLHSELYSHISLIPAVSLFFMWTRRRGIFAETRPRISAGGMVVAAGLVVYGVALAFRGSLDTVAFRNIDMPNDYLTLCMAGFVAWAIGSFIVVYGRQAAKRAMFPLGFLAFMIPIPTFLLHFIMTSLQHASAEVANLVFMLSGAPYVRSGLVFEFSNVSVRVAEECSGIRSSLAFFILSIITGYMFLQTVSRRLALTLAIFPITVIKNAFRIVTITLLANYVDMRFLSSHWIHTSGGIPFFAVGLAMFVPLVWVLRRSENSSSSTADKR
jgi:exosortase